MRRKRTRSLVKEQRMVHTPLTNFATQYLHATVLKLDTLLKLSESTSPELRSAYEAHGMIYT